MRTTCAVSVGIADIRHDPDPSSELVTQALMNVPVLAGEISDEWTHATLSDYEGWIRTEELAEPPRRGFCKIDENCATPLNLVAIVNVPHSVLYAQAQEETILETVYLSTCLPLLDTTHPQRFHVALPGERVAWISRQAASMHRAEEAYPQTPISTITSYARAFIDVPYLWGGTSWAGIDCSGLVQLCYRMGSYILPRDADQQHDALTHKIKREEMREGDLIFFGRTAITHVALALNNKEYIHAEGQQYNRVTINSFESTDEHYNQRLSEIVWSIKRVVP